MPDKKTTQTCNVPGCTDPLGERGVWCTKHHPDNRSEASDE